MPADTPSLHYLLHPHSLQTTLLPSNEHQHPPNEQQQQQQHENEQRKEAAMGDNDYANTTQSHPNHLLNDKLKLHDLPHDVVSSHDSDVSEDPPPEFALVDLLYVRKEVQCPICLGIIKKTRTVMECLHRFCRECIDKSMRMGNNECPACRTHCASRRSLRDDPRFDELIATLYPDIKKFEEEELAFYEEDDNRNKQIQESISQVIMKQTEALGKKRSGSKDTIGPSLVRSQRNYRGTQSRRRRRRRRNGSTEYRDSDDNNDGNDSDKNHSVDEYHQEMNRRKQKRPSITPSQSPSTRYLSGEFPENNLEQCKDEKGFSPWLTCSPEMLTWGKSGVRSNTQHSNVNGGISRSAQRIHLAKFVDFLRNIDHDNECLALEKPLKDENHLPEIQAPKVCCDHQSVLLPSPCSTDQKTLVAEALQDKMHILGKEEKLSGPVSNCITNG